MMKKKRVIVLATCVMLVAGMSVFAGAASETEEAATGGDTESITYDFPDKFPDIPKIMDPSAYAYDDMSVKHDFEILTGGYWFTPVPEDGIELWLEEKYNVDIDIKFMNNDDLLNTITVRFVSDDPPDFMSIGDKNLATKLHEQGQLLDVYPYLKYVPQMHNYITKDYKEYATYRADGAMFALPRYPTFAPNWAFQIRQDWLDQFGMDMPATESELFEFAKAATERDPNRSGKNDTWFMGGAGGGASFTMLESFRSMYGEPSWNIKDGKINHPNLDGSNKSFVTWIKKLYDAGVLHPDWFTIAWEPFTAYSMNDQIGMVWYPGWNLIWENTQAHDNDVEKADVWETVPPPKADDGRGGMYPPAGSPGRLFVFPKSLAKEEAKLKRIFHVIDMMIYPNEAYLEVIEGGGEAIWPGTTPRKFYPDTGLYSYQLLENHKGSKDEKYLPMGNWNTINISLMWVTYEPEDLIGVAGGRLDQLAIAAPRHKNYDMLVSLDAEASAKIKELQIQREMQFVLGEKPISEWDDFVAEWKKTGGQLLMDQAAEQLGVPSQ